jgi:large subunit ribosomal protein L10
MPNLIKELILEELSKELKAMGSCLVLGFDKLTVKDDQAMRTAIAQAGYTYMVIKNRIAARAFSGISIDAKPVLKGKCGVLFAKEEGAIGAAKLMRDLIKKKPATASIEIRAGVLEGRLLVGPAALAMADLPDRKALRTMMAAVLSAPARKLATALNQVGGGMARVIQANEDKKAKGAPDGGAAVPPG